MGRLKEYFLNNLSENNDRLEKMHYLCIEEDKHYGKSEGHIQEGTTTQG